MEILILLTSGILGAVITYLVNNRLQLGGVMASAGISVLVSLLFLVFPELLSDYLTINIPPIVMGASFIGMATERVIPKLWIIGLAGSIFPVIFLLSGSFFEGFGGSLGTTAALSLSTMYGFNIIRKKLLPGQ